MAQGLGATNPADPGAAILLGSAQHGLGQLGDAAATYRAALERWPDLPEAHHNLGVVLQAQQHLKDALASYSRAIELKPDSAEGLRSRGSVHYTLGELKATESDLRRALAIQPGYVAALSDLATCLWAQSRLDEAEETVRVATTIAPDFEHARHLRNVIATARLYRRHLRAGRRGVPSQLGAQPAKANQTGNIMRLAVFSPEECRQVVAMAKDVPSLIGQVGGGQAASNNRQSTVRWLPLGKRTAPIYERTITVIRELNASVYHFDLLQGEQIQFTEYHAETQGFYDWHVDAVLAATRNIGRKLSITIQLSDPADCDGGDLRLWDGDLALVAPRQQGLGVIFPHRCCTG